jgi:phosphatidylglycerol:prolipoprotein diacylglycerol transferase
VLKARGVLGWRTGAAIVIAAHGLWIGAKWHQRLETLPVLEALWLMPADLLTPGMRIPGGLLTGAVLAGLWCLATRAPWRETGDALAVAASLLIVIGRMGCFVNGCCMGGVCHHLRLICLRYPPGTESYDQQVLLGLITNASPLSSPAHPLPLYFAAASLVTLVVLLVLLRRGAAPGTLLAVFCIVRPATKLALEPLRVSAPDGPAGLMLAIPLGVLMVTVSVLGVGYLRRLRLARAVSEASQ